MNLNLRSNEFSSVNSAYCAAQIRGKSRFECVSCAYTAMIYAVGTEQGDATSSERQFASALLRAMQIAAKAPSAHHPLKLFNIYNSGSGPVCGKRII